MEDVIYKLLTYNTIGSVADCVVCWAINLFPGSFVLAGLTEAVALPYLGIKPDALSLDDKAEILLFDQGYAINLDSYLCNLVSKLWNASTIWF